VVADIADEAAVQDIFRGIQRLDHVVISAGNLLHQGSITFTSGGLSSRPRLGVAMFTAALAVVEARAPALALELAPIRVNAVAPGLIDTPLLDAAYGAERDTLVKNRAAALPERRIGTPEEVTQLLLLMTNAYVNGAVLHVDGGGRYL
jgi:NAD(P)-dependent dehydrogenase (short-subunit alcohol dehydrogenase family)